MEINDEISLLEEVAKAHHGKLIVASLNPDENPEWAVHPRSAP